MNALSTSATRTRLFAHPFTWSIAWLAAWIIARGVLEQTSLATWIRVLAALLPVPIAAVALFSVVRGARELDELERRIQLEALATAFLLAVLFLMTLGLLELAITLNRDDWSYRHVWAMLPMLYFAGLAAARRRYQ
jgi:hypothetical protein